MSETGAARIGLNWRQYEFIKVVHAERVCWNHQSWYNALFDWDEQLEGLPHCS